MLYVVLHGLSLVVKLKHYTTLPLANIIRQYNLSQTTMMHITIGELL